MSAITSLEKQSGDSLQTESMRGSIMAWFVICGLLAAVAAPAISLPGYRVTVTALMAPIIFLFCLGKVERNHLQYWSGLLIVCVMGVTVVVSAFWSYLILDVPVDGGDIAEAYKYLQFIPYLIAIQFIGWRRFEIVSMRCVTFAAVIVIVVGCLQWVHPSGSAGLTRLFGASDHQISNMIGATPRILLTGSDPNIGSAIGAFFLFYFTIRYMDSKKIFYFIISVIFLALVFKTQSRTGIAAIVVAAVAYGFIFSKTKLLVKIFVLLGIAGCVAILVRHLDLSYVSAGIQQTRDGDNASVNDRIENFSMGLEWFKLSPIFGWGPAKAIHGTVIDSEIVLILERYGVVGILVFISYIVSHLRIARHAISLGVDKYGFHRLALLYMLFGMVFMLTNNLFSGYQLMSLVVLLISIARMVGISKCHTIGANGAS